MLVLVRKCDESIVIGDDITVTVLALEGDRIKLGIKAPREVTILRQELRNEVIGQNRAAVDTSSGIRRLLPKVRDNLIKSRVVDRFKTGVGVRRVVRRPVGP